MTDTQVRTGYKPWHMMNHIEKNVCVAEVVIGWQRHVDIETKSVRWTLKRAYSEMTAPSDFPPDFVNSPNALLEIKRMFDTYGIAKLGSREFIATVNHDGNESIASGISENDAFAHAAVVICGGCV